MSQVLSQSMSQQMRLEQRLSPRLVQSMALLQKPIADLEAYINDALETNAALELAEPEQEDTERSEADARIQREETKPDEDGAFGRFERFTRENNLDFDDRAPFPARHLGSEDAQDRKMGAISNTAGRGVSLQEHLLNQWSLTDMDESLLRAGEAIINHLDPDGYLRVRLEEVGENARPPIPLDDLQMVLAEVQQLEPTGVGARDLVECLLLQLDTFPGDNKVEKTLIEHHLGDIMQNRLPAIAKTTGYSIGEINEAIRALHGKLCLHPGYLIGDSPVPAIRPDVIVDYAEVGDGFTVRAARGNAPQLRIRGEVAAMARSQATGKEAREFARKQIDAATLLIEAVKFRQNRLVEVTQAIVREQRDFFDLGPQALKVCRMTDIAASIGCDPSTISRTAAGKYMQTPRGIYPLRYFFTGGTETEDGVSVGWDRVKIRVRELIDGEDRTAPLSDAQIDDILKKDGIEVSRRTVAKYRQQLGIPTARQRRQWGGSA